MRSLRTFGITISTLVLAVLGFSVSAETLVIEGGTIHSMAGDPFVGTVVVEDGVIRQVAANASAVEGATRIDASGLHVYPGFFDATSQLGLVEVSSVAATVDSSEQGDYNPHLQAATAVHPASEVIPVTRANGITHAVVAPQAGRSGVIGGQAALLHLAGWTVEEMAIDPSIGMMIRWPEVQTRTFDFSTFSFRTSPYAEAKEKAEEKQEELRDWLAAARHYAQAKAAKSDRLERNLKLEALAEVASGNKTILLAVNQKADIEAAVKFVEAEGLSAIFVGGRDAWQVKDLLAESGIPVVLGRTQSLPREEDSPYDQPFRSAGELAAAGVKIAFASGGGGGFGPGGVHSARTLPYESAMAVAYGLSEDEALKALTLYPAQIFGVEDQLGSLEVGKIGNVIVTDGSPLEITTQVRHLVIQGQEVSLDNKHEALYQRYRSR